MLHTAFIVNNINQAFMKAVVKKSNCILDYELNEVSTNKMDKLKFIE